MFTNIGGKIKSLAKIICWIGIVAFGIIGIAAVILGFTNGSGALGVVGGIFGGALIFALGALASWVGSFMMYGFGELIENTNTIAEAVKKEQ